MNTIARYIALPVVSAGIIGGAAVGLAGVAGAATTTQTTGHPYAPSVTAKPAAVQAPGWHNHHGIWKVNGLTK